MALVLSGISRHAILFAFRGVSSVCFIYCTRMVTMERNITDKQMSDVASRKRPACDADILALLWEGFRTKGSEIDSLLDLSLSILSSTSSFPQKEDLEASLKKALSLVRTFS
jgi:hypothetical protein